MSITKEQIDTVNQLVKDGEIEAARKLLTKWGAAGPLAKLNTRYPIAPTSAKEPIMVQVKPSKRSNYERVRNFVLFIGIIVLVIGAIYMTDKYQRDYAEMSQTIERMR